MAGHMWHGGPRAVWWAACGMERQRRDTLCPDAVSSRCSAVMGQTCMNSETLVLCCSQSPIGCPTHVTEDVG